MKKLLALLYFSFFIFSVSAGNLQAYLSYCTFVSPTDGPYLETYLSFYTGSIELKANPNGKWQGTIQITMIFRQNNDIKDFKKYELRSPEIADTNQTDFSFIDQQRILLPNGEYELEIQIQDVNSKEPPLQDMETIKISYPEHQINISGIQLIESYTKTTQASILSKSGYDFIPYISNYYPKSVNKLTYYSEIYHTDEVFGADTKYLLSAYVQVSETGKPVPDLLKIRRESTQPVNVFFSEFDISKLPSGNYLLVVEARNQKNEVVASNQLYFQRNNPDVALEVKDIAALDIQGSFAESLNSQDSLREYIKSLDPISTESEKIFATSQLKDADLKTMQQYFLNFWMRRDNANPGAAWDKYYEQVKAVDAEFKTPIKKGYETDRGRIYLKYGPPNTIADQPFEASSSGLTIGDNSRDGDLGMVPYQIWQYYQLKDKQQNVKFVFANPNIATNDYALIHSTANGEINNPNWQYYLHRDVEIRDKDEMSPRGRFGGKSGDLFNNPR